MGEAGLRRLRRYVLTAGVAAAVDLGGFAGLSAAGVPVVPAAIASFLVANVVNFRLSARYAFGWAPVPSRYPRFLAASGVGLSVNVVVTGAAAWLGLPPVAAKLMGIGVAFGANFALNAVVVFPEAGAAPPTPPAPRGSGPRPWRGRASRRPS